MWRSPTLSAALTTLYASGPAKPRGRQGRAVVRRSERGRTGHHPRADAHAWHARATAQSHFRHARWRRLARRPRRRGRSRAAVEHAQVLWATRRRALMTRAVRADWEAAHALTTADTPCIDSAKCNRSPVASHALTIIICAGGPHEAAVAPFGARLHAPCALRTIYLHRSCAFVSSVPCNSH